MVSSLESSDLEQMFTFRRKWLPHDQDDEKSLARGLWLEQVFWKNMSLAISGGIARAFTGK